LSTITKLNYKTREERTARAALLRELAQSESDAIKAGHHELAAKIVGARDLLTKVAKSPERTGARKQQLFTRVARELMAEHVQLAR